jgi:hypothetical protein
VTAPSRSSSIRCGLLYPPDPAPFPCRSSGRSFDVRVARQAYQVGEDAIGSRNPLR